MNIVILGSTGSIGTQTLELLEDHKEHRVLALSAGENISLLEEQARKWRPKYLCVFNEDKAELLKDCLKKDSSYSPVIFSGMEGLIQLSSLPEADMIVVSVVGMVGIQPTISAIQAGKKIALANKETLVCAGHIINDLYKNPRLSFFLSIQSTPLFGNALGERRRKRLKSSFLLLQGGLSSVVRKRK